MADQEQQQDDNETENENEAKSEETTATVKNLSKQLVTVILDHGAFANADSGWRRGTASFANGPTGGRVVSEVRRSFPGVLTIAAGETVKGLHPAVRNCLQVQNLVAQRILSVVLEEGKSA